MFERQCKLSLISIKLYLSAVRCLNALRLKEVLAILVHLIQLFFLVPLFLNVYYLCIIVWQDIKLP